MGIWSAQQARKASSRESWWYKYSYKKNKQRTFLLMYNLLIKEASENIRKNAKLGEPKWSCKVDASFNYNWDVDIGLDRMVQHDRELVRNLATNSAIKELKRLGYKAEIREYHTLYINWKEDN